jgi:hypothetical protein
MMDILVSPLLTRMGAKGRRFSLHENLDSFRCAFGAGTRFDSAAHLVEWFSDRENQIKVFA